ncbi:hypothetical protein HanPI659440_Chr03g0133741 [Helianthus annuus]|nr:hypothetical protein HanPI659440_Chr03g0133741 [Helianthus annuus]
MGDSRLKINVARYAAENSGGQVEQPVLKHKEKGVSNQAPRRVFNLRDTRSYREAVGASKVTAGSSSFGTGSMEEGIRAREKSIVVPDRTGAFKELVGVALVGRTVDIETLVDFDRLLRIAKFSVASLQYLGGLSLLISFHDADSAKLFLDAKDVWGPWFSKLDYWSGQTLPLERVAWLRLYGIPLHLLDPVVLGLVGEAFGRLLHIPKFNEGVLDLSYVRVGVLVGLPGRIREEVSLNWKDRAFKIWVEEDSDEWVPDCLDRDDESVPEVFPSPVVELQGSGLGESNGYRSSEFGESVEKQPAVGPFSHMPNSPSHEEREKVAADGLENKEVRSNHDEVGCLGSSLVGPGGNGGFEIGSGGGTRLRLRGVCPIPNCRIRLECLCPGFGCSGGCPVSWG